MSKSQRILIASLFASLIGCASNRLPPPTTELQQLSTSSALITSAAQRGTYVLPTKSTIRLCAEPMPDAVLDQALKTVLELAHKGDFSLKGVGLVDVAVKTDNAAKRTRELFIDAQALPGLNGLVKLAREALYRNCELALNYKPGTPAYKAAADEYRHSIAMITTIATAELTMAEASKANAEAAKAAAEAALIREQALAKHERIDTLVDAILGRVTKGSGNACKIDASALDASIKDTRFDGVRDALKKIDNCDGLGTRLRAMMPADLETIVAALPTPK